MKKILHLLVLAIVFPSLAAAGVSNSKAISVEGVAYLIVKPDIAHCFVKVEGEGNSYALAKKNVTEKMAVLHTILKNNFSHAPEITVIRAINQPKEEEYGADFDKKFVQGMAKAIKGENLDAEGDSEDEPNKFSSIINVFFSIPGYEKSTIEKMKSDLAEKEIAFDKQERFSFYRRANLENSFLLFGLEDPSHHLESLVKSAFEVAQHDATVIAQSTGKKVGNLIGISGCGGTIEGTADFDDSVWIGKDLGPLSADPERLNIQFEKSFDFKLH